MLRFIIDGWNLVHKIAEVKNAQSPPSALITYIIQRRLTGSHNNEVIIVFDGYYPDYFVIHRGFTVLFSEEKTADEVICQKVNSIRNRSGVVVVTDDREILDRMRQAGVRVMKNREFLKPMKPVPRTVQKDLSDKEKHEITEELRKYWLSE